MPATKASRKEAPIDEIHTLHKSTCPTSTGKAKLGYKIGADNDGGIYFKVSSNSGGGFFSDEWVALTAIQTAWKNWPKNQPVTSFALSKLFRGKSANNPGFLTALLLAEGLLERDGDNKRVYRVVDPAPFLAKIRDTAKSTKKPARKAASSRRKAPVRSRKPK